MARLTTDEQLEQIWNAAIEAGIAPVRTKDRWGEPFTIFDGWNDVEAVAELICTEFPVWSTENAPSWEHLPEDRRPNPYHHIEWAIGEFGFEDQYTTCEHCYTAIDMSDHMADYHMNSATGAIICGDCLRTHKDFADDYLTDMAAQLRDDGNCIYISMAKPEDHDFVCINGDASRYWVDAEFMPDHPDYDSRLTFAHRETMQRLGRAAQIIDPRLQFVYAFVGGSNRIWARFNPDENVEFSFYGDGSGWDSQEGDMGNMVLGYAISRVIVKWVQLQDKAGWK